MLLEAVVCAFGALALPPGFVDESVLTGFEEATGLTFDEHGRMFVWEKAGRVHIVENGVRLATPLIDLREEVNPWRDFGLLGFALDPHFEENGYVYLLYTVDYHHVQFFGTPQYNPASNNIFVNTIGRLTRYTARASDGHRTVDPASRLVLIGETRQTGLPVCHQSHSVGSLAFAHDGTLLLSNGDGASYETSDDGGPISSASNTALAEGIITQTEDVGAYRAQLVNSMSGKILRVDPATGDGVPSNPYFDPAAPRAPRSRVWSLGLRNPFRFSIKPGTGEHVPSEGDPGEVWVGDVGWNTREELNVARGPGVNFGWPIYEGMTVQFDYEFAPAFNRDAPNPLVGTGACTQPFFGFRNLLVQATQNAPSWPNPCNPAVQVPASVRTFVHTRPVLDWRHGTGPARAGTFANGLATTVNLGAPGCPIAGEGFGGNSATGGVWYTGSTFPAAYQGVYFFADFGAGWLRVLRVDAAGEPVSVELFSDTTGAMVCMAVNPVDGSLQYINYDEQGQAVVRRIRNANDLPPVVVGSAAPPFGPLPLAVEFSGLGSTDPEGLELSYSWDFGDGSPAVTGPVVTHTYTGQGGVTAPQRFDATLTVRDPAGNAVTRSFLISANNTPPRIVITEPPDGQTYPMPGPAFIQLQRATVVDDEHGPQELTCVWQTLLHHNEHNHPELPDLSCATQSLVTPVGCDGETYSYEFRLTVTDGAGLTATASSFIVPRCCTVDFSGDGIVSPDDLDEFITTYFEDSPERSRADFNADGLVSPDDLDEFITAYFEGC